MSTAIAPDWPGIKAMYIRGLPAKQIAEQTGVSFGALRARITRQKWDADVTKVEAAMSHAVTCSLQDRAVKWVAEIDGFVRDSLTAIKKRDKDSLNLKDLKTLLESAEIADRMGRRTYGLENESKAQNGQTLVCVTLNTGSIDAGNAPVIEIGGDMDHVEVAGANQNAP